jgi:hypothetical protein
MLKELGLRQVLRGQWPHQRHPHCPILYREAAARVERRLPEAQRSTFRCTYRGPVQRRKFHVQGEVRFGFDEHKKRENPRQCVEALRIAECPCANFLRNHGARRIRSQADEGSRVVETGPSLHGGIHREAEKGNIREHGRFGNCLVNPKRQPASREPPAILLLSAILPSRLVPTKEQRFVMIHAL